MDQLIGDSGDKEQAILQGLSARLNKPFGTVDSLIRDEEILGLRDRFIRQNLTHNSSFLLG